MTPGHPIHLSLLLDVDRALWLQHGILLGMRCTRPRVVPVPLQQTHVTSLDLMVWASVPREIKISNATITSIDNDPLTIVFDQQDKALEEYMNELHFRWKGNV